jgi:hypothetical protein
LQFVLHQTDLTSTNLTMPFTLSPEHSYVVKVRAIGSDSKPSAWSNAPRFQVAEQKTRDFRIRLLSSVELAGAIFGKARFRFTIQAVDDDKGRPALGPPRILTFTGTGIGIDGKIPFGFSATSDWADLTTSTPIDTNEFNVGGSIVLYPSISFPIIGGLDTRMTLVFQKTPSEKFTQYVDVNSTSIGITILTDYFGFWTVGGLDKSLWPNYSN